MKKKNTLLKKKTIGKQGAVVFLALFFLSACGSDKNTKESGKEGGKEITLTAENVGPITAESKFNMHEATLAFSDYNVVEELNYHLGAPYPVIRVSKGIKTLLIINPDKEQKNIYSVIVEDNIIDNKLGHRIGTAYKDVYQYGKTEDCQLGVEDDMSGKVLCYAPKTPNVLYVFNGKHAGASMPPAEVLQEWSLESIIWRPKS